MPASLCIESAEILTNLFNTDTQQKVAQKPQSWRHISILGPQGEKIAKIPSFFQVTGPEKVLPACTGIA